MATRFVICTNQQNWSTFPIRVVAALFSAIVPQSHRYAYLIFRAQEIKIMQMYEDFIL